ncbi:MAG: DUF58 domain-containing protein [Treponema sp.]|nr:DUF58 domain-containing protein [Treponema sp.]
MKNSVLRTIKGIFKTQPFTLPGVAVFAFALAVLVRSLAARNAYEIVLSLAALALLAALWLAGRWAARRLEGFEPLWNIPLPLSAGAGEDWLVTGPSAGIPKFFRLHVLVRGRFFPQGSPGGCPVFAQSSLPKNAGGDSAARLGIRFPLGGRFRGETSCRLRDIFGLYSFACGAVRERTLNIRSAPCTAMPLRINAQSGAEDRRKKSANDEERYYMREYAPGDRLRDINWKSSERINTLITRISPDNQEKITRIEVYFRNYGPPAHGRARAIKDSPAIAELWLLDRAKARLAWFLRKVKEEKASYVFHVRSATESWELNDEGEIEAFLEELPALPFAPAANEGASSPPADGELYVFSTACDTALPAFLLAQQGRPLSLFMTQNAPRKKVPRGNTDGNTDRQTLHLRDFPAGGLAPLPWWLLPRKEPQPAVSAGRVMIDYTETRV